LFELAGVDIEAINWLDQPARIHDVYFAGPVYRLHTSFHPEFRKICSAMVDRATAKCAEGTARDRVFLGRGRLKLRERLTNESEVFDVFEKYGFELVFPETLSVADQICLASKAKHLAGPIGSQLYLALFQMQGIENYIVASHRFCFADDAIIGAMYSVRCRYLFAEEIEVKRFQRDENFTIDPQHVATVLSRSLQPV
jgi:capsular polysaccharide biosynthesis protein